MTREYITREEIDYCNKVARKFGEEEASQEYFTIKYRKQQEEDRLKGN